MKAIFYPSFVVGIFAFALGGLYARWQVTDDCLYLSGFKAFGKVYVCEGMTESVNLQTMEEHAALKRPL